MINSSKENDAETLAADKVVSDLSEEQLRDVLEQLTDHKLPNSEKCLLVRQLNAENASKDESDLVISTFCKSSTASSSSTSTFRNSGRKSRYNLHRTGSKDAEYVREKPNVNNTLKEVHSSQSLQDLMSANSDYDSMRSIGARKGNRLNKASRANSFTMPSGSQNFCNSSELSSDVSNSKTNSNSVQSQQSLKSSRNKNVKRSTSYISTSSVNESQNKVEKTSDYESEVLTNSSTFLDSSISSLTSQECYATQSVHLVHERENHNMDCDKNPTLLCNNAHDRHYMSQYEPMGSIELQDLRKKVKIIEYSSEKLKELNPLETNSYLTNSKTCISNNVDSGLDFGLTTVNSKDTIRTGVAERVYNNNTSYDSSNTEDKCLQLYQGNETMSKPFDETNNTNSCTDQDLANLPQLSPYPNKSDSNVRNISGREKKKKKSEPTKLAEQIEGHIGYIKDIEVLEAFVNFGSEPSKDLNGKSNVSSNQNTNPYLKDSLKKNEKSIIPVNISKRKYGNNVSPNQSRCLIEPNKSSVTNIPSSTSSSSFSSDEANSVSKHSEFAQKTDSLIESETTSPINSIYKHNKNKTALIREDSDIMDSEKLSHSTVDSTFSSLMSSNSVDEHFYAVSDSEMADREKGFVTPKSKYLKRRRRIDNYRNQKSPILSMQSSVSTTPSSSTVSGTGVCGRGYESEREYTEEYRRKQEVIRRKSTSSVPHSEQNSAYNSDGELSSHSMPVRNDTHIIVKKQSRTTPSSISSTPKASYADITKSLNIGVHPYKRCSVGNICTSNVMIGTVSVNTNVQYEDFPQLELPLTPVEDVSSPSSTTTNNSNTIEALVSHSIKSNPEKMCVLSESSRGETLMTTSLPHNECLLSETVSNSNTEESIETIVPPVIMCDYSDSVPISDIGSVTFGFFEDLNASSGQQTFQIEKAIPYDELSEQKAKIPIKPSPETASHVNNGNNPKVSGVDLSYIDVDKKSFNYDHIIGFIKKAWDNAKRDYRIESYEPINEVN